MRTATPDQLVESIPLSLSGLYDRIHAAVQQMGEGTPEALELLGRLGGETPRWLQAHLSLEHSTPSPSGVTACRLQQYGKAKGWPITGTTPAHWTARAAAGVIREPYWLSILTLAGLDIRMADEAVPCGPHMLANPDAYIGDWAIVELKDLQGWTYKRVIEGMGIAYEEPRYYAQCQLYMHATDRKWCLFMASTPDPAMLQSMMRNYKKNGPEYELPLVYLEWVERRDVDVAAALARAEMIAEDIAGDIVPPRDFDGKVKWPCSYCPVQEECRKRYG